MPVCTGDRSTIEDNLGVKSEMSKRSGAFVTRSKSTIMAALATQILFGVAAAQEPAGKGKETSSETGSSDFRLGGYVRSWVSFNLQNPPETAENDRGDVSMVRGSVLLDADLKTGPLSWKGVARVDREYKTRYLGRLEALAAANTPGGPGSHIM